MDALAELRFYLVGAVASGLPQEVADSINKYAAAAVTEEQQRIRTALVGRQDNAEFIEENVYALILALEL